LEILVEFLLAMLATAGLLWLISRLDIGLSVSGFGAAFAAALVLAAYGLVIWLIAAAWRLIVPGDFSFLLMWVGAAFFLWLTGKFVPGVQVKGILSAFLVALVYALMYVAILTIVGWLNLG
jgi:uncharacterized membrane protein YvlD (DUF360 family)